MQLFRILFSHTCYPPEWKKQIKDNEVGGTYQLTMQEQTILSLQRTAKICKYIHTKSVEKIFQHPRSEQKWTEILNGNLDWGNIYSVPFNSTFNQRLRYFQFRVSHRIIGVNKLLFFYGFIPDRHLQSLFRCEGDDITSFLGLSYHK